MIRLTLAELAAVVGGDLAGGADPDMWVTDVQIDSRTVRAGSLFVPVRGERRDGHDFVADAIAGGATAFLWEARRGDPGEWDGGDTPRTHRAAGAVIVDDPADALMGLGAWVRQTVAPTVVTITGSSGKTTTKDLCAAAVAGGLGVEGRPTVVANPGSYNNELGVPLTCCLLEPTSKVLIAEIGARGVGHIARLAPLVAPDIAVVTMVGAAHLEMLGTLDVVARAKEELVEALDAGGVAVLNIDDHRVARMAAKAPGKVTTYGFGPDAQWRATDVEFDEIARPRFRVRGVEVALPVAGEHNIHNALAALAAADEVGVPVHEAAPALARAQISPWRMELRRTEDGVIILNDAYNANVASMTAALKTMARMEVRGRRWAVLGHMAELGSVSGEAHADIGRLCVRLGIDRLLVVGEGAAGIHEAAAREGFFEAGDLCLLADADDAIALLQRDLRPGDAVLVKASRSAGLERVAIQLAGETQP